MNIEDQITQYLTYWNKADVDGLMSMYDEAILYNDMPSGEVIHFGDLKDHLSKTFTFEDEQSWNLNEAVFPDRSSAFIYWTQTIATETKRKVVQINGVELIVFREGKIVSIHEFYDYGNQDAEPVSQPSRDPAADQMTKLGLTNEMTREIAQQIERHFTEDAPYLDPDLSLTSVSKRLGHTRNQISFVLNNVLEQTFYDLVNQRRIEHVIEQMSSSTTRRSILEMAINAGFNSMSGFYNAFKRQTGMSPVQFQKTNLSSDD